MRTRDARICRCACYDLCKIEKGPHMKKRVVPRALLAGVSMAIAMPALAQNLLQDPRFDVTINPRIVFDAIYDADHSALTDGTGSAAASVRRCGWRIAISRNAQTRLSTPAPR